MNNMQKPQYNVASFSGGKDSTAMVLRMIERGDHLDEVLFCDTTMEFPAMLRHVEKVKQVVEAAGIKFTTLRDDLTFEEWLLEYTPVRKNPALEGLRGKSWPGPMTRWCTQRLKERVISRYFRLLRKTHTVYQYIGMAADEQYRLERKQQQGQDKQYPLVKWGWTEADALAYCYEKGYDWEGLYDLFDRVSCWCCPLQPLSELRTLRTHFPDLWSRLKELDEQTWRTFKENNQSVENLDCRFALEEALAAAGHSIKNRAFFADLKRHLAGEASVEDILNEREKEAPEQLSLFNWKD
jgi:3'-phosphoadenosine 5'-phosphosulfate sulfotransferase (PAPS reductase)/FAD synthetase